MSEYTKNNIDVEKLPTDYRLSGYIPVKDNSKFFKYEGMGFVLEEARSGLIKMYDSGTAKTDDVYLLTESGLEIKTTGSRTSRLDYINNQPIIIDRF